MANSVYPDETAVSSRSALFAYASVLVLWVKRVETFFSDRSL